MGASYLERSGSGAAETEILPIEESLMNQEHRTSRCFETAVKRATHILQSNLVDYITFS